ncbi:MAG: type II toxin-antitoxin system HipA family toxin [Gammaproteobacteria bacterium]|nr:type II toxin-antitoxin system HipA family toxin [Gammaproteobacteria bacterium]MYD77045.1 type II toxin-antitoxin system HipA family toxin [Gammaproteobacteria bacterium]MYJ53117.1 type II toxin-antitoxin system HipA family toxin [Gammaproteobacteria bacterium]
MGDPDLLNVWHKKSLVGQLWRSTARTIGFRYDPDWIAGGGFAISRSLPLAVRAFVPEEGIAQRWFANLLPEGAVREHIVRDLKLPDTDFDLLRAIGGECAGALSILPVGRQPSGRYQYRPLTDKDLTDLAVRRGQIYAAWLTDEHPRLSLAGTQNKCPVLVRGDQYLLPKGEAPSSHILKFELVDYRHLPAYETFTTQLATAIDLPVVDISLCTAGAIHYAQVARYDRMRGKSGEVQRLHQEDFCQALGYGHERKYQEHGGPSFAQCFRLVQEFSSEPAIDAQHLLRWQIFNVLAGNSDGHAKNLSLLHLPGGATRLAPFYDLVCTRAIERIDYRLAFDVGGERNPGVITSAHWEELARQCDVRPQFLDNLVRETADALQKRVGLEREAFEARYGAYSALQRIEKIVTTQCRRVIR